MLISQLHMMKEPLKDLEFDNLQGMGVILCQIIDQENPDPIKFLTQGRMI